MAVILAIGEDYSSRPAQANSSQDPHLQNKQNKMDWRYGSNGRAPVLQVQNLEFKPSSTKIIKKKSILKDEKSIDAQFLRF
jgi:hypothetical protein